MHFTEQVGCRDDTFTKQDLDLALSTIFRQMSSLLSRVGAFPSTNRDAFARVRATFIRRTSVLGVRLTDDGAHIEHAYLVRNQRSADLALNGHKTG